MELKPCAQCGGDADYKTENFGETVWIKCCVCGMQTGRYDMNPPVDGKTGKDWATITWNRRARNG